MLSGTNDCARMIRASLGERLGWRLMLLGGWVRYSRARGVIFSALGVDRRLSGGFHAFGQRVQF